jgi:CubicO group peptidase (beta-lactamase class C family)
MAEIEGKYEEQFKPVADALSRNLDSGADVGASVAVFIEGEPVVDIWGGYSDTDQTRRWEQDTLVNVFSTTKTMTFVCALMLADRGELDFDAPVTRYWPEFAAAGKDHVLVRHLLGHTAGLSGWEQPLVPEDLADWEKCTELLAAQEPWWEPGTASGYHAVTQGYLIGEVLRRITGSTIGTFFRSEVAEPLGADFFIGTPASEDGRVLPLIPPSAEETQKHVALLGELGVRTLINPPVAGETSSEEWWRRAEIPAAGGHGNARSVAAVQSVIACGGEVRGKRLLSEEGVRALFAEQSNGTDLVLGVPLRYGLGYGLSSATLPMGPNMCAWGGYGGSIVFNDLDTRTTFAYVMNRMEAGLVGDERGASIGIAVAQSMSETSSGAHA